MSSSDSQSGSLERTVPLCVPEIRGNEWAYVKECLDTNMVSSVGSFVSDFEKAFAKRAGTQFAVATVNGTSALHIAVLLAGIEAGDEVLVSDVTFIASANAIRYAGAWPVFIDAEPRFWQMDPERVRDYLERECEWKGGELRSKAGRRVRAIMPVHILGHPVEMEPILLLARKYGLRIIEDASESLGATWNGRTVGAIGDVGCFSFNGNKLITTGGGGMITTDNEAWAARAKYLTTQAKDDSLEFVHGCIGYNYRLTNIQAALGVAQLEDLDARLEAKRRIAGRYAQALAGLPGIQLMAESDRVSSAWWLYTILLNPSGAQSPREILRALNAANILARPLWQPMHLSPAHRHDEPRGGHPVSDTLYARALSLPSSVGLSLEDQQFVIERLSSLIAQ